MQDWTIAIGEDTIQEPTQLEPQRSNDPPPSTQECHSSSILDEYVVLLCRYEAVSIKLTLNDFAFLSLVAVSTSFR